jgi:hypothetical protein
MTASDISNDNKIGSDKMDDPVREYLLDKGCGEHVIKGGLAGLVAAWENVVASVAQGYNLGLDDYLNDLDARQLLTEAWAIAPVNERQQYQARVDAADAKMQALLEPADECLWGDEIAEEEGWTREEQWWYFGFPRNAGEDLRADYL